MSASFEGGGITSDAGVLRLRQLDRELGLIRSVARRISDPRNPKQCQHRIETVTRQQMFGMALGYEDLVEQFIRSHNKPLKRLILDFDATDDPVHGEGDA